MNALLAHKWGVSPAQDRVWAQVTGLAPGRAVGRLLMALEYQAFMDASARAPDGDFVLGGYIGTAETWAAFSKEWEALLPLGTRAKNGKYHFKMSEMAHRGAMDRVALFHAVIDKYPLTGVSGRICLADFDRALERANVLFSRLNISNDFQKWTNPYFFFSGTSWTPFTFSAK